MPAAHWLRLSMVRGVGPMLGRNLVQAVGGIDGLWAADEKSLTEIEGVGSQLLTALRQSVPDSAQATQRPPAVHESPGRLAQSADEGILS